MENIQKMFEGKFKFFFVPLEIFKQKKLIEMKKGQGEIFYSKAQKAQKDL